MRYYKLEYADVPGRCDEFFFYRLYLFQLGFGYVGSLHRARE